MELRDSIIIFVARARRPMWREEIVARMLEVEKPVDVLDRICLEGNVHRTIEELLGGGILKQVESGMVECWE